MIYGLIYTSDKRNSNVEKCLEQETSMEFEKCVEGQKMNSFKFKEISWKPFTTSKLITSYGIYEPILPGDGVLGYNPYNESLSFDDTDDYQFSLYDKNFFFPTLNYLSVPRTTFRINKNTAHYQINFQVSFRNSKSSRVKFNKPYDEVLGAAQLVKHVKACKEVIRGKKGHKGA